MNDKQILTFQRVVQTGTLSEAARQLYISPQAVSQQIDLLECDVGFKLLRRSTHGVTPTEAGNLFYAGSMKLSYEMEQLLRQARAAAQRDASQLKISMFFFSNMMGQICRQFSISHPEIRQQYYTVPEENWISELERVLDGTTDVFEHANIAEIGQCGLLFLPLLKSTCSCVMLPTDPLAQKERISVADLSGHTVAVHSFSCVPGLRDAIRAQCVESECVETPYGTKKAFDLCSGGAVFIVPTSHAGLYLPLRTAPFDPAYLWEFGLVYRKNCGDTVKAFLETAKEVFKIETAKSGA